MFTPTTITRFRRFMDATTRSAPHVVNCLQITFIRGPKQLLTSRISAKCAAAMMAMCAPSLLVCSLLTIPSMIFQSPNQNAYFHFSRVLEHDPSRWFVFVISAICAIMSLAIPATMPKPRDPDFSLF